ncbi:MAG: chemotaxis protein CheW [Candidatus Hodarchaeota archaeon]
MTSNPKNNFSKKSSDFLKIRLNSTEFVIDIRSIDGIAEYSFNILESPIPDLFLGNYSKGGNIIPIFNLKKYLNCKNSSFLPTTQSRILFIDDRNLDIEVGFGISAILSFYRNLKPIQIVKTDLDAIPDLKCFQIESKVIINTNSIPILDLKRLIDLSLLKNLLNPDYYQN